MGRVLMWLFGVPVTVVVLFAISGERPGDIPARDAVKISNQGSDQ